MLSASTGPTSRTSSSCASSAPSSASSAPKWRARSLRGRLADVPDAQRVDEPRERRRLALLDRGDDVRRGLVGHALERREIARSSACRGRPACARCRHRRAGRRACRRGPRCPARAGSAKCSSACLRCAGQTEPAGAARDRLVRQPHDRRAALRAARRHRRTRVAPRGRLSEHDADDLRDHVARAPHDRPCRRSSRPCAATSSSLCSVALVTVTPPTNTGSSRATGVIAPVRPTCTSMPSDLGRHLLGRKLVRDRPARLARDEAELLAAARAS